ncbi:LIM domain only protein 7-like [Myxocyprinus asiaticus]|uniref:LIM domain only protein 7-like n=1 Tax=Myxocyprinus asiaticus TaxID=70543 RepID=UPI002223950A|nr:LIM domain only protein 7-like [Myxocyprinus asiaticus]
MSSALTSDINAETPDSAQKSTSKVFSTPAAVSPEQSSPTSLTVSDPEQLGPDLNHRACPLENFYAWGTRMSATLHRGFRRSEGCSWLTTGVTPRPFGAKPSKVSSLPRVYGIPSISATSGWSWDHEEERRRQEKWQMEQERLLQEKYRHDQEKLEEEWRRAQQEVYGEEHRVPEEQKTPDVLSNGNATPYIPPPFKQSTAPTSVAPNQHIEKDKVKVNLTLEGLHKQDAKAAGSGKKKGRLSQAEQERLQILEEIRKRTQLLTDSSWIRQHDMNLWTTYTQATLGPGSLTFQVWQADLTLLWAALAHTKVDAAAWALAQPSSLLV